MKIKNIKLRLLLSHIIITLTYPVLKALISEHNQLLIFTDAITIIAVILLLGGVVYGMVLHGDFDISGFYLKRGVSKDGESNSFRDYLADILERREESFNYPLFLGFIYLASAALIAYCFL